MIPMHEKPYDPPLGPPVWVDGYGECEVIARVQMARSAAHWADDIKAYLVEQELSVELADPVIGLMDAFGFTVHAAVAHIRQALKG
jgi:hypothetical protein